MTKQSLALAYAMKRKSKSAPQAEEPLEDLFADMPDEETPEETGLVEEGSAPGPSILERIMSKRL